MGVHKGPVGKRGGIESNFQDRRKLKNHSISTPRTDALHSPAKHTGADDVACGVKRVRTTTKARRQQTKVKKEGRKRTCRLTTTEAKTHHGNIGLGSILEPGEELSRSDGQLRVRLPIVPERVVVSIVLVLHGVERYRGVLFLQLAHAPGGGGGGVRFSGVGGRPVKRAK